MLATGNVEFFQSAGTRAIRSQFQECWLVDRLLCRLERQPRILHHKFMSTAAAHFKGELELGRIGLNSGRPILEPSRWQREMLFLPGVRRDVGGDPSPPVGLLIPCPSDSSPQMTLTVAPPLILPAHGDQAAVVRTQPGRQV